MRSDVIIAGAGPAGALAGIILARAGVKVSLFDRARFPRAKLCGDTLNPGAMRVLDPLVDTAAIVRRAVPLDGMLLTGPGVMIRGSYGGGQSGRAIVRREFDAMLLAAAIDAGVDFHDQTLIDRPLLDGDGVVRGVTSKTRAGTTSDHRADLVLATDGRESRLARAAGLARHATRPRRWAIGAYFERASVDPAEGAAPDCRYGEMHVRPGHYIGVAPVPGDLTNVCLVMPHGRTSAGWRDPAALLQQVVRADAALAHRFAGARMIDRPDVLGPMAVDARACGVPGMLLAGDAAGFIDPITGDGLRLALHGGRLAADVMLDVLAGRCSRAAAAATLADRRRDAFTGKWRFNRGIRALLTRPTAVTGAAVAARVMPGVFRAVIRYAGDCA